MIVMLYVLAIYLIISAIFWPFQVGKTRTYSLGYAVGNALTSAGLAILFFALIPIVERGIA